MRSLTGSGLAPMSSLLHTSVVMGGGVTRFQFFFQKEKRKKKKKKVKKEGKRGETKTFLLGLEMQLDLL